MKRILILQLLLTGTLLTYPQSLIRIQNKTMVVSASTKGGELMSIRANGKEYLWNGNPQFWQNRAPIMFPVNVRFRGDSLVYNNQKYSMPFMGIVKDMVLPVKSGTDKMTFILNSNDSITRNHYPFPFTLKIEYSLHKNRLRVNFSLKNTGDKVMYYALGAHPGFQIQLNDTLKRDDYEISFAGAPLTLNRTKVNTGLLTHEKAEFLKNENSIALTDKRIVNTGHYIENHGRQQIGLGYCNQKPFIILNTGNFPNLNIWTPSGFPFVCLEPMVSHHDYVDSPLDIAHKSHLISLRPGKKSNYHFEIIIQE